MVRRPTEVFLKEGETPPPPGRTDLKSVLQEDSGTDLKSVLPADLPQEELLKLPVYLPHRPKKDPRELKILDPACGSGHFLLYCFDLLLVIYEEAYDDPDLGPALKEQYPNPAEFRKAVPGLILSRNLHGIDIDLRASQIAALALWLRTQRAYQEMGLKGRESRPRITRSNLVCAEPMPGERDLLDEFLKALHTDRLESLIRRVLKVPAETRVRATRAMADSLCELVRLVWDRMRLAGEAGSLLKIEEELQEAVRAGQEQWEEQHPLFRVTAFSLEEEPTEHYYRFVPGDVEGQGVGFWDIAERLVLAALEEFAAAAAEGDQLKRRLFVADAVRGLGFVDICQRRFDAVLMNPPFGLAPKAQMAGIKKHYPTGYVDLLASFVQRGMGWSHGKLGAITSRSVLLAKKLTAHRAAFVGPAMALLLDLGSPVMDDAMVQSCAYVLDAASGRQATTLLAFDRRKASDKADGLEEAVRFQRTSGLFVLNKAMLAVVPQNRILYALPDRFLGLLGIEDRLGTQVLDARLGMRTFDHFRFLRLRWEVPPQEVGPHREWEPISKGGEFAEFYSQLPLLVRWSGDGEDIAKENMRVNGQTAQARQASLYYRLPGGTWSRRCRELGVRVFPAGCIIGEKGPVAFPQDGFSKLFVIGLLNSALVRALVNIQANAKQYDTGIVKGLPWKPLAASAVKEVEQSAESAVRKLRDAAAADETDPHFVGIPQGNSLVEVRANWRDMVESARSGVEGALASINSCVDGAFGISSAEIQVDALAGGEEQPDEDDPAEEETENHELPAGPSHQTLAEAALSYWVGCAYGRWDVRFGTGDRPRPALPDPFDALPLCSPGMLTGSDGWPASAAPPAYPLRVQAGAIMVEDPGHADDIVGRVQGVLELVWKDRAEAIEQEACEILGVKELRDYFRKPGAGGFWADHVARYSKSRRKAPIYWLLQSSKKNYALWLYYHRLDKDILFKALMTYVEPKLRLENGRLAELRGKRSGRTDLKSVPRATARQIEREMERQEAFLSELADFRDNLERAANLHLEPDLNDGVVLNIAPLWELVPWKEAKAYWDELLAGKYEWSSIGKQLRQKGLVK
jgi:hypothetical protein